MLNNVEYNCRFNKQSSLHIKIVPCVADYDHLRQYCR